MRKLIIPFFLISVLLGVSHLKAQSISPLCICFNNKTKYIEFGMKKDSTFAVFNIVKKGYETKEKREQARKKYLANTKGPIILDFSYNFASTTKPKKYSSQSWTRGCASVVSVRDYRLHYDKINQKVNYSGFIFVKALPDGTYLKWRAIILAPSL